MQVVLPGHWFEWQPWQVTLFVILCQKEGAMAFDFKKEYKMFYKPIAYQKAVASKEKS